MERDCFEKKKDEKIRGPRANVAKGKLKDLVLLTLDLGDDVVSKSVGVNKKEEETSSIASCEHG